MKKVALVFVLAVFVPSLVLAWLAVRSVRDQQFVLERQQSLLLQGVADRLAQEAGERLAERQREFSAQVEALLDDREPGELARIFDEQLGRAWPLTEVGFVVTLSGSLLSPSPWSGTPARDFCLANGAFLCNREAVEVYWNTPKGAINLSRFDEKGAALKNSVPFRDKTAATQNQAAPAPTATDLQQSANTAPGEGNLTQFSHLQPNKNVVNLKRAVSPQQSLGAGLGEPQATTNAMSKVMVTEAEFRQLIGESSEGTLARFVDNRLKVMFWHRPARAPELVFGAQLDLKKLAADLQPLVRVEPTLPERIAVALLDDAARPMAVAPADFRPASWKRPFVATEIGETLPHWELAVYLLDPGRTGQSARTLTLTIALLVTMLLGAISAGGWLIVADLRRQLTLARQKTDFVSNVSHELKTPLTSIRMFAELLAEDRVAEPTKQKQFLGIIGAESARLTRLINNVLDFARLERGEKTWQFSALDLRGVVREAVEACRPQLEAVGITLSCELPTEPVPVSGDRDALAQVVVNLLSNVEKYAASGHEAAVRLVEERDGFALEVLDRGPGVPAGCESKIFEQFFRAHDSLASGIQGSGLGLTLARQIARAHGGDVTCSRREGGGSVFTLRLPSDGSAALRAANQSSSSRLGESRSSAP